MIMDDAFVNEWYTNINKHIGMSCQTTTVFNVKISMYSNDKLK
jgi:hypothetical protein